MTNLEGITFTTADGVTIQLNKNSIPEDDREIEEIRRDEIKEKTISRKIGVGGYSPDEKNGKVIRWSKKRIWRHNILKNFDNLGNSEIKNFEHSIIAIMHEFKEISFTSLDLEKRLKEVYATATDMDTHDIKKRKQKNALLIDKGVPIRMKRIYLALGSERYTKFKNTEVKLKSDQDKIRIRHKMDRILKEDDPFILRWTDKNYENYRGFYYMITDKFLQYSHTAIFNLYEEYRKRSDKKRRNNKIIIKPDEDIDFRLEIPKTPQKIDQNEDAPVITKNKIMWADNEIVTTSTISEKSAITRYIVDKILENPRPGTVMKINNDASIEFKF